ncbi:hypothetical protein OCA5_c24570 [Afipia carboxidovorans OM5]|uniref:Uncharacterized protein n=2 Tax=Afipia carboxidovorans TaxID=40137 RepID=F8BRS2_AFIC5|nr:hypothetical protein OCA4_c24560 [Afipia carboxidovorans OM4]AEI07153.1 hypothetical protein OCA5_c24570 [Afipia carboxidovorans OM5]
MGKFCPACGETKARTSFYKHPHKSDGLQGICKECHKTAMKRNRRENPDVQERDRARAKQPHRRAMAKALVARWREVNPDLYLAQNAINNAIRDGKLKRGVCACGAKENVFGIAVDPKQPLRKIKWECARCYHRSRFEREVA